MSAGDVPQHVFRIVRSDLDDTTTRLLGVWDSFHQWTRLLSRPARHRRQRRLYGKRTFRETSWLRGGHSQLVKPASWERPVRWLPPSSG